MPGAPLPDNTIAGWQTFGDRQTEKLGLQYDRTVGSIDIVKTCEAWAAKTRKKLEARSLWQRLTPWRE